MGSRVDWSCLRDPATLARLVAGTYVVGLLCVGLWIGSVLGQGPTPPITLASAVMGAASGTNLHTVGGNMRPVGVIAMPTITSATIMPVPAGADVALISPETQNIRWRDDGTAPTATVGMILYTGDTLWYSGDLSKLQLIEVAATAGGHVAFYDTD